MDKKMNYDKIERAAKTRKTTFNVIVYSLLGMWAIVVLFPFYWMVLTAIKSYGEYNAESIPGFIAKEPTLENFFNAFERAFEISKSLSVGTSTNAFGSSDAIAT